MSEIIIPIPPLDEIHDPIEIEVKINGKKKKFNYRVEALDLQPRDVRLQSALRCRAGDLSIVESGLDFLRGAVFERGAVCAGGGDGGGDEAADVVGVGHGISWTGS